MASIASVAVVDSGSRSRPGGIVRRFHLVAALMVVFMGGAFLSFENDQFGAGLFFTALFFGLPVVHFLTEKKKVGGGKS